MSTGGTPGPIRSLATARAGEAVMIRRILFGTLRNLCADLGVFEGDVVDCRAGTATHLVLRTAAGRTIPLDREWTRFIQISEAAPVTPAPEMTRGSGQTVETGK